ncbi:hypothetical protein QEN19_000781 [Hanseniaspora menglaensis]
MGRKKRSTSNESIAITKNKALQTRKCSTSSIISTSTFDDSVIEVQNICPATIISAGVQTDIPFYDLKEPEQNTFYNNFKSTQKEKNLLATYRSHQNKMYKRDYFLDLLLKCQ